VSFFLLSIFRLLIYSECRFVPICTQFLGLGVCFIIQLSVVSANRSRWLIRRWLGVSQVWEHELCIPNDMQHAKMRCYKANRECMLTMYSVFYCVNPILMSNVFEDFNLWRYMNATIHGNEWFDGSLWLSALSKLYKLKSVSFLQSRFNNAPPPRAPPVTRKIQPRGFLS